jgi:Uma2 family endonuclease
MTPEEYLATEIVSHFKREFVGGHAYPMAETINRHNLIVTNTICTLHSRVRGKEFSAFGSDTKVRIRLPHEIRFCYPDGQIVARSNSPHEHFQDEPVVVIEVMSSAAHRTDMFEKCDAYLTIPSLSIYLMIEQNLAAVTTLRRTSPGFEREVYQGLDAVIPLPEIDADLQLSEVYDGVEFIPEVEPKTS